jgi:hypothetical protein
MKTIKKEIKEILKRRIEAGLAVINKMKDKPFYFSNPFSIGTTEEILFGYVKQSTSIKLGDSLEEIMNLYFNKCVPGIKSINDKYLKNSEIQFDNLPKTEAMKELKENFEQNNKMNFDFVFSDLKKETIYVFEIKIKDNHDSSKRDGQLSNLVNKVLLINELYEGVKIVCGFFFVSKYE